MADERLLRARAEAEAEELREELSLLQEERLRLARRNERLTGVLLSLRADPASSESLLLSIEDALDYDGRDVQLDLDLYAEPLAEGEEGERLDEDA
jgi:hypothetical protein